MNALLALPKRNLVGITQQQSSKIQHVPASEHECPASAPKRNLVGITQQQSNKIQHVPASEHECPASVAQKKPRHSSRVARFNMSLPASMNALLALPKRNLVGITQQQSSKIQHVPASEHECPASVAKKKPRGNNTAAE